MVDYFIFSWLQFSHHFAGNNFWSWEFHWKGSNAWYHNFRRKVTDRRYGWATTRLTLRFGKRLMVIGSFDMIKYYKGLKVLEIKHEGVVTYQYMPKLNVEKCLGIEVPELPDGLSQSIDDMKKMYYLLSREYPSDTWRN